MPGLAETIASLTSLRRGADTDPGLTAMVETTDFGSNPGALRMLSYAPAGLPANAPLVVVLHGCTQRAVSHASAGGWLTLADRLGFVVLAPEQSPANNPNRCFNWYEPENAARDRGEAASIRAMVAHAVREHGLDPSRVFVTGLSAGGAMTSVMLAAYPDVFAAGAIVAGLPFGVADNVQEALGAMYGGGRQSAAELGALVREAGPAGRVPRVSIWHGSADHTVRPHNAVVIARQWTAAHGLAEEPDETQALPGRTRAVWRSPEGETLVESVLVHGLGHGTPLDTADGVGSAGPYMLEAGVSSSLEIARFWGLAEPVTEAAAAVAAEGQRDAGSPAESGQTLGGSIMATVSPHVPADIQGVIQKALAAAGLMR